MYIASQRPVYIDLTHCSSSYHPITKLPCNLLYLLPIGGFSGSVLYASKEKTLRSKLLLLVCFLWIFLLNEFLVSQFLHQFRYARFYTTTCVKSGCIL